MPNLLTVADCCGYAFTLNIQCRIFTSRRMYTAIFTSHYQQAQYCQKTIRWIQSRQIHETTLTTVPSKPWANFLCWAYSLSCSNPILQVMVGISSALACKMKSICNSHTLKSQTVRKLFTWNTLFCPLVRFFPRIMFWTYVISLH